MKIFSIIQNPFNLLPPTLLLSLLLNPDFKRTGHPEIIKSFYLAKYEVTVEEFEQFTEATHYETDADKAEGSMVLIDQH